jgi:D-3-phosphoglycerate dehydrogenase
VIRSATQVTAEVLEAGRDLVVVGRAGIGLDNVDVAEATRRGVMVVNAPQSNILSAAEHSLALLLAQARNIPQAHNDLRSGKWNRSKWEGVELNGKTLGIVGLGRVGVLVAQRAHAFGMRLAAFDPFVNAERARQLGVQLVPTIEELFALCDFVSIHATKTPQTIGLVNTDVLKHAKPGLRLINAGRGGIVDEMRSPRRSRAVSWAAPRSTRSPQNRPPSRRCSRSTTSSSPPTWARRRPRRRTRPA